MDIRTYGNNLHEPVLIVLLLAVKILATRKYFAVYVGLYAF